MASEQHSSEPVITRVLAYGQNSPKPASQAIKSDEASTSTNHLSDLDLLFELFYDEFLGSNVKKSVVVDRMEDSTTTHPTSSDISTESNSPILQEIPVQMPTLTVEAVTNNEDTKVVVSVGCSVQTDLQTDQAVPAEPSAPTTSTTTIIPPEQPEEEHSISQIIGDPTKPVQTRSVSMNMCMHESFLSKIEPSRISEALADSDLVTSMQEELNQFDALEVWRLVPKPQGKTIIGTKNGFSKSRKMKMVPLLETKQDLLPRDTGNTCCQGIQARGRNRLRQDICSCGAFRGNSNVFGLRSSQELHCLSNGREDRLSKWHSKGRSLRLAARRLCQSIETESCLHSRQSTLWTETSSSRLANPKESHLSAVKRIFRYLKGTADLGPWYPKYTSFELTTYTDADHAGCMLDRKSTSGHIQFLGDKLVSWASKKQLCVSNSTAEAEYVAAASCCSQVLWMRTQLRDYGFHFNKIPIYCDSKSAIAITTNPVQHTKTKHIDARYHFIKDNVEKGTIELFFVKTDYQLADLFTKPLDEKRFTFLVSKLGMLNLKT
ncbi:hypothetical protein L6452_15526 [Arctium lappa]|uniref:Uncharacterized protein n=1 Tax=Arctium lappa TaxID=4217 RepID=A0ACB9CP44_ARCLA|nr:hypothetical protein L6452_15526 [Arctium lappa]